LLASLPLICAVLLLVRCTFVHRRYARTGKENRKEFEWFTKNFFLQRPTLTMVLLLVDSSIPPQAIDLEYAQWLGSKGVPFSIVFTKADKRKKGGSKKQANVTAFKRALLQQCGFKAVPPCILMSASSGDGKQELLAFVAGLRVLFEQQAAAAAGKKQAEQ
jgi:GTP-binding protein